MTDQSAAEAMDEFGGEAEVTSIKTKKSGKMKKSKAFVLSSVPALLKPYKVSGITNEAYGDDGKSTKLTVMSLTVEVGEVRDCVCHDSLFETLEFLFPGINEIIHSVSSNDERPGFDLSSRKSAIPDLTLDFLSKHGAESPFIHVLGAAVQGKPVVKVNEDGATRLSLKLRVKLPRAEAKKLDEWVGADFWLSAGPTQIDIAEKL